MTDLFHLLSAKASYRHAQRWLDNVDHTEKVGAKHHIVPMMILRRFSNLKGQLYVRDRSTGEGNIRNAGDLAVRDFNTVVTKDGRLDSSLESLLSVIEGASAAVLHAHLDADSFARPRPFTSDERFKLDTFTAMQAVRGMRGRRAYELLTDYGMKLLNQNSLTPIDVEGLTLVPHPNEHHKIAAEISERAHETLASRPMTLLKIDRPLFLIGDEPVLLMHDAAPEADPSGCPNVTAGIDPNDVVQVQSAGGVGIANAEAIIMPLSPRAALCYGPPGNPTVTMPQRYVGIDADEAAEEVNSAVLKHAISWVAAHPDHVSFAAMAFPPPVPLLRIIDGGTAIAQRTNTDTRRRPIGRVRPSDLSRTAETPATRPQDG